MKKLIFLLILGFYFPVAARADLLTPPTTPNDPEKESNVAKEGGMLLPDGKKMASDDFVAEEKAGNNPQNDGKMILPEEKNVQADETEASPQGKKLDKRGKRDRGNHSFRKKKEQTEGEGNRLPSRKRFGKKAEAAAEEPAKNEKENVKPEESTAESDAKQPVEQQPQVQAPTPVPAPESAQAPEPQKTGRKTLKDRSRSHQHKKK